MYMIKSMKTCYDGVIRIFYGKTGQFLLENYGFESLSSIVLKKNLKPNSIFSSSSFFHEFSFTSVYSNL